MYASTSRRRASLPGSNATMQPFSCVERNVGTSVPVIAIRPEALTSGVARSRTRTGSSAESTVSPHAHDVNGSPSGSRVHTIERASALEEPHQLRRRALRKFLAFGYEPFRSADACDPGRCPQRRDTTKGDFQ